MKLVIIMTVLGMAACAVQNAEPSDPPDPSATATTSTTSTTEQAISPLSCPVPWEGPGNYYFCDATGVWEHNLATCRATCSDLCELGARCNSVCQCIFL